MTQRLTMPEFIDRFAEEPGYFDFATAGPVGRAVRDEEQAQSSLLARARFGTMDSFPGQDERVREAIAAMLGFRADQIGFQPSTSQSLMEVMFGLTGVIAASSGETLGIVYAITRAAEALGTLTPKWIKTDHGRVTPGSIRRQLGKSVDAVAVSLVDHRTGYLADLEGIREVIGDRLLIVDAIQGFGAVDAPYELADIVVGAGQKWVRAGWGTGFIALSDRAAAVVRPVLSGWAGTDHPTMPDEELLPPGRGVRGLRLSIPDPFAQARLSAALEELASVGVPAVAAMLAEQTDRVIDLADEFGIPVASSRDRAERAGIVVLSPQADQLTVLNASLHNHGVAVTTRSGLVRVSPHVTTSEESFAMLRASFLSFGSAINV
jgi:selenocysteine lyase/cysteine desulfurase